MQKNNEIAKKIIIFCIDIFEDFLIIAGLFQIIYTTYKISSILGGYVLGIVLFLVGSFLASRK